MKFWNDLSELVGKELETLGHGKAFDVVEVSEKFVIVRPHETGVDRKIDKKAFIGAFEEICSKGSLNLKGIRSFSEMNPVYVAAMLAELPYITSTKKPINLKFSPVK